MDILLQFFITLWSLFVLALAGGSLMIIIMAVITLVTKDKYLFRKILKKFMED